MNKKLSFYKPRKQGGGAAMQFDFNPEKACVFLEAANQSGEQQFDWQNKIIFKMNDTDLAKVLTVSKGKEERAELFHDPTKAPGETTIKSNVLSFSKTDNGFFAKLSRQAQDGKVQSISLSLSPSEGMLLTIFMRESVASILGF